ncbi:MAG: Gfo/Idh/MocA family oxidoreductase [bacterium]|nr:Gfo/Idh/MocA family oxidoreductase [bacterium]
MPAQIGFLGTGFMGQMAHLANYAQIPDCRVIAIAEHRPNLAKAVAEKYGIPKVYPHHQDLLNDPDIQAVICSQPFHNNYELGKQVLAAGKSLFTEKPMVGRVADGRELIDLAKKHNVLYAVGFMKRYDPGVRLAHRKIREVIQTGELGALKMIDASCFCGDWLQNPGAPITTDEQPPPPLETRYPEHIKGGLEEAYDHFLNIYSHNINLIRYLLPDEDLTCLTAVRQQRACVVTFSSGDILVSLRGASSISHKWEEETHFIFEQGRISVYTPSPLNRQAAATVTLYRKDGNTFQETRFHPPVGWAFFLQAQGFVSALLGKESLLAPGSNALRDAELMEDVFHKAQAV